MNIDDTQEIEVGTPNAPAAEAEEVEDTAKEEPGETGDPDHGLPGEAEEMPEGDAERDA